MEERSEDHHSGAAVLLSLMARREYAGSAANSARDRYVAIPAGSKANSRCGACCSGTVQFIVCALAAAPARLKSRDAPGNRRFFETIPPAIVFAAAARTFQFPADRNSVMSCESRRPSRAALPKTTRFAIRGRRDYAPHDPSTILPRGNADGPRDRGRLRSGRSSVRSAKGPTAFRAFTGCWRKHPIRLRSDPESPRAGGRRYGRAAAPCRILFRIRCMRRTARRSSSRGRPPIPAPGAAR